MYAHLFFASRAIFLRRAGEKDIRLCSQGLFLQSHDVQNVFKAQVAE